MVKGWGPRGAWGFPKGKVNKNESEVHCAIREVREETSYDISPLVRETDYINVTNGKQVRDARLGTVSFSTGFFYSPYSNDPVFLSQEQRYFIVVGASTTFEYAPRTRKEIGVSDLVLLTLVLPSPLRMCGDTHCLFLIPSPPLAPTAQEIAWHRLADLPTKKDVGYINNIAYCLFPSLSSSFTPPCCNSRCHPFSPQSSRKGFFNVLAPLKKLRKWIKDNRPAPPAKFAVPMYQPMQLPPPLGSTAAAASAGSTSPWVDPAIASSGLAAGAAASPAGPGLLPFDGAALLRSLQQASPATSAADGPPPTSAPARSSSPRTESAPFAFPPTSGAVLGPCSDMESFRFDYGDILQGLKSQLTL